VAGNIVEEFPAVTKDNWNGGVQVEDLPDAGEYKDFMKWDQPLPMPKFTVLDAATARQFVLANAGATLPRRDAVDARVIEQVRTGKINADPSVKLPETQFKHRRMPIDSYKIGIITDPAQVGGYPDYKGTPYADADGDGMPDDYERKNGLDPKDPKDAAAISKTGYANIEHYLNGLVNMGTVTPVKKP
jgi:hypothetical protein